jgi:PAS domain S-box-containing protein
MNDPLITGYNFGLVIVSVVIAILASYTAIYLAERVTATQSRVQLLWLLSGATAMGTGIWSMHFIGMLAFRLPVLVYYDFFTVCLSILPAIIASGLALFLVSRPIFGGLQLLGGSLFMGLGIVSMHYIGMAAMRTSAVMYYNPLLVTLSVVIAIAVSLIGLFFVFQLREETTSNQIWKKVIAAIIMGAAIPIMHYIGMAAAYFIPMSNTVLESELKPPENVVILAISVIIGTLIILGLALLTIFFDRRLSAQIIYSQAIKDSQKYLKTILQNIQSGVLVIEEDGQIKLFNQAVLDLLHLSNEAELQQLWDQAVISHVPAQDLDIYSIQTVLHKIASKQPVQNAVVSVQSSESEDPTVLLVNAISLTISTSSITQMICTLNDITELKLTEEKLKKSETQFRELARQEELLNYLSTQIRQSLELPIILQTAVSESINLMQIGMDRLFWRI